MSQLSTIIKNEYKMDIQGKSFWIATFLMPLLVVGFGFFIGYISQDSDAMKETISPTKPDDDLSGMQILGMLVGMFLSMFIMIYGAQIFNKVKNEKTNRIVEIIVACVPGRTMMMAKVISVGLIGMTQLFLWGILIIGLLFIIYIISPINIPYDELFDPRLIMAFVWSIIFFVGGYIFYGSLYAAVGALTDKNNENQEYMTIITFILLASFYIGIYAVDNPTSSLTQWCSYIPMTSPTIAAVGAISGDMPIWQTLLSVIILYATAILSLSFAGKIYTSALLLKGKKLTPKDILIFLKSK